MYLCTLSGWMDYRLSLPTSIQCQQRLWLLYIEYNWYHGLENWTTVDYFKVRWMCCSIWHIQDISDSECKDSFSLWAAILKTVRFQIAFFTPAPCFCFSVPIIPDSSTVNWLKMYFHISPHNCSIVEIRLSSFSWKPQSTHQAVQLLKK